MYRIVLTEYFEATHHLDTLRPKPHSHRWIVRVVLQSRVLEAPGIVMNYYALKPIVNALLPHGKNLNETYDFAPTGENLACHFYQQLKSAVPTLLEVAVGEFEEFMCYYTKV